MAADRGRDLSFGIVSDTTKFDLTDVIAELEDVEESSAGAAADLEKTTDELKRLAVQGKDAEKELARLNAEAAKNEFDELGKDAKAAATKVDHAFDAIAKSAKTSMDKVEKEGEAGFDEFKDEAAGTSREVAASFGSVEDALGGIQEIAANAFAGFGPAGAAAGIAVAGAMGLLTSQLQAAADKANEVKDRTISFTQALIEAGGEIAGVDIGAIVRDWSLEIADNKNWWEVWQKSNTTNLDKVRDAAQVTGLAFGDMLKGLSGTDQRAALDLVDQIDAKLGPLRQKLDDAKDSQLRYGRAIGAAGGATEKQIERLEEQRDALLTAAGITKDAEQDTRDLMAATQAKTAADERSTEAQRLATEAAEAHAAALQTIADEIDAFTDPLEVYTTTLQAKIDKDREAAQATADATKSGEDDWSDYVHNVNVSLDEYIAALNKQVEAQAAWAGDLKTLGKQGVDEGVIAELRQMGPKAAPLVHQLTTGTAKQRAAFVTAMHKAGKDGATKTAEGLDEDRPKVTTAARQLHQSAADQLTQPVKIPTTVAPPPSSSSANAVEQAQAYADRHPVYLTVKTRHGANLLGVGGI